MKCTVNYLSDSNECLISGCLAGFNMNEKMGNFVPIYMECLHTLSMLLISRAKTGDVTPEKLAEIFYRNLLDQIKKDKQ